MSNTLIQEAYYGKLPEFEEMEKMFDSIIKKANKDGLNRCNPNKYPEHKKICNLFSKIFGFKKSLIYWEPFNQANAYTLSMNTFIVYSDNAKNIVKTDRGFYDNSKSSTLTVFISVGLLKTKLSSRQIIAIILHEIGHNFDYSIYHKFNAFLANILTFGQVKHEINENKNKLNEIKENFYTKQTDEDNKIYNNQKRRDNLNKKWEKGMKDMIKHTSIFEALMFPCSLLYDAILIACMPINNILHIAGKKGELFSDSFATAYGYGAELVEALQILGDLKIYYNPKSPVMKFFMDLSNLQSEIVISLLDVHGTDMERCQECIEKLKWDLKHNDFQPELKEELVNEINKMTKIYKSFYKFDKDEQYKITKIFRRFCAILFHGKPNIQKFFKRNKV